MRSGTATTEEEKGKIRVGTALIKQLSTSFYPNARMIFDEMVSNSRDAMASTVKIQLSETEISIEDDGEGMTPQQLVRFFYISHTDKPQKPVRTKDGIKREIIGRFGIGKLSLYQLCKRFEITTWRDGTSSTAEFNFEEFEKNEFIDDFDLKVKWEKSNAKGSGTRLVLHDLKQNINGMKLKRDLMKTMPLTRDFKITIGGIGLASPVTLVSQDIVRGNKYEIDEFVEGVGNVKGVVIYKPHETAEDYGVYIRVFGRLVNLDNPREPVDFPSLAFAYQFHRRIYAELNVNGLNDALLTNRSGFIVNHPAYLRFKEWMKSRLNRLNRLEYEKYSGEKERRELEMVPRAIADILPKGDNTAPASTESHKERAGLKEKVAIAGGSKQKTKEKVEHVEEPYFVFRGRKIKIKIDSIPDGPEGIFDKKDNAVVINSTHPMYVTARSQGKMWGVLYHSLKTAIILIALETSRTIDDFKKTYDELTRDGENISNIKLRGRNSRY